MSCPTVPPENASLLRLASLASVSVALTLLIAKSAAWSLTGSASILASLVDSLMDVAASLINFLAIRYSLKGADRDHRFGHGKAESLAGLVQASFIAGSAVFLLIHTSERLFRPQPLAHLDLGLLVMLASLGLTIVLVIFQRRVIRRTNSTAIRADSLHYLSDILTTLVTIAALILSRLGWPLADPILGLGIAAYILLSAAKIAHEAICHLMDRELSDGVEEKISAIVRADPRVVGMHDLRTRQSGQIRIIQFHLDLPGNLALAEAHTITKQIEQQIKTEFPDADLTIHQDPA